MKKKGEVVKRKKKKKLTQKEQMALKPVPGKPIKTSRVSLFVM